MCRPPLIELFMLANSIIPPKVGLAMYSTKHACWLFSIDGCTGELEFSNAFGQWGWGLVLFASKVQLVFGP